MKSRIIILLLIFLSGIACSEEDDLLMRALPDHPDIMTVFCQSSVSDTLQIVDYEYSNNMLISETTIQDGVVQSKTTFAYNSINRLFTETYLAGLSKTEKSYSYNDDGLIITVFYKFTTFDTNGQITRVVEQEAPREYEHNRLVKEWEYWGGYSTYEYSGNHVSKRIDYTKSGEEHHITTYKYSGNLLREEKKATKAGALIYLKKFEYDAEKKLTTIRDGDNIIEENKYLDNKLIEKKTYYFGIDPGFDVCYGNYIYRYAY